MKGKVKSGLLFPFVFIFSFLCGCFKPVNNVEKTEEKVVEKEPEIIKGENKVIEYDPLIESNEYHEGFEKRKYSTMFSYEPHLTTELPRMDINSLDGSFDFITNPNNIAKSNLEYTDVIISMSNCDEKYSFIGANAVARLKGNYTFGLSKKPLNIKFEEKRSLLGLNNGHKFKKWSLHACCDDYSYTHDIVSYYLGKQLFNYNNIYSTDCTFLELYVNNEYWGMYLLVERPQIHKNRVNINDIEDRYPIGSYSGTDIGYLIEVDGRYLEKPINQRFTITHNNLSPLKYYNGEICNNANNLEVNIGYCNNGYSIKSDIYSNNQTTFIRNYIDNLYKILYNAVYNKRYYKFNIYNSGIYETLRSTSYDVISEVVNVESFVDMYILQEIICDCDGSYGSQFFAVDLSKGGDKRLTWCALWDKTAGFGNHSDYPGNYTNWKSNVGLRIGNKKYGGVSPWYLLLIHENWFWDMVKEKWKQLINNGVLYNSLHYIDECKIIYEKYCNKDWNKWHNALMVDHISKAKNYPTISDLYWNAQNYKEAADTTFKWLAQRYNNLNSCFGDGSKLFTF